MKRHFEDESLMCDTSGYQRHREKMARTNLKCTHCSFETLDQAILNNHVNEIHTAEQIQCQICNEVFSSMNELEKHDLDKHTKRRYKCEICDFDSTVKWYTEKHMESHEGYEFQCKLCDFQCKYSKKLRIHTRNRFYL
uniref:Zinc finger protein 142 n=1 Tax=Cacopsylla melanoneura TaxID=428564 RepID=A0A8D9AJX8_9HEMI